ncbi:hypothetical protein G6F56_009729 [Rhizopus delemar]|nr:hypothetical protein G6F56_009729 [Rhizopus delemar]
MNNNNNTNDINMADANLAPINELELVKSALAVLKRTADTLQREHDMAINGGTYDPELAKKVKDARSCYKQYKKEPAERFPEEEIFALAKPRAREPHGQVYTNVKEFISHLEHYCMGQIWFLDDVHPKCMPMLLGTSYRTYVEEKMQSISKDEISWTLIKRWLFEFVDTPKQRVKNIKALLNMRPEVGESSDKFITSFWSFHNSIEAENSNLNEVIFVNLMSGMSSTWKQHYGAKFVWN